MLGTRTSASDAEFEGTVGRRPNVWVVDDSPTDAARARGVLEDRCQIDVLADGSAVLERLASEEPPDVLVLDWLMPGVSGIEVVRFLRSGGGKLPQVPVLLLTAYHEPSQIAEGLSAGANDYLPKPFTSEELRARVGALLRSAALLRRAQDAERAVRALLADAPDALLVAEGSGRFTYANREAGRAFGRPAESLIGQRIADLLPDLSMRVGLLSMTGLPLPDVRLGEKTYSPSLRALSSAEGGSRVISLRDVTDRRRLEQRRLDFYSIIAHDLRSPLSAVMVRIELLLRGRRGQLSPELTSDVQLVDRNLRAMLAMINDFLDLARLEGTEYRLNRDAIDVSELLSAIVEELRPLAEANRLRLEFSSAGSPLTVLGDRSRLSQVVSNLVGNALKFTPAGGAVTVSASRRGEIIEVEVRDTGPGIAPETLPHLFDRFTRAGGQERTVGSGLGLMIVREIIHAHGGTVGVRSEPGKGSTFWFKLPAHDLAALHPQGNA